MAHVTPLHDADRPETNFIRLQAGGRLSADAFAGGWPRIVKICPRDDGEIAEAPVIVLPRARSWAPKEIIIVDAAGDGFVLLLSGTDQIFGEQAEGHLYHRPVLRLTPLLSDLHDESDGWASS
jgi:hypothetical protein